MPAPTDNPIAWADDATWTSGSRSGEDTKITPPSGVAEQGFVGDESFKGEYANAALNNYFQWLEFLRIENGRDQYGDGSDGDVTPGAGTTTLARDMYYDNLTVGATTLIDANGYRIFVRNTLTITAGGVIHNDGSPGLDGDGGVTGGAGGAGAPTGSLAAGGAGGAAGSAGNGVAGSNTSSSLGGNGGAGGDSNDGGTGAAGGTASLPSAARGGYRDLHIALGRLLDGTSFTGGAGGGGGGGGTSGDGGSGGGGGGPLLLWARITVNDGEIRSNGGDGGSAYTGPDAAGNAGGGSGGGGPVIFVCRQYSGAGTVTSAGGAAGAGFGTGDDGVEGDGGLVLRFTA